MKPPKSLYLQGLFTALALGASVAASAVILGLAPGAAEAGVGLAGDGSETPMIDSPGFMEIATETFQIAAQLSGYADTPRHKNAAEKITRNASEYSNAKKQPY